VSPPAAWLDSHCHVHEDADPVALLERAGAAGVSMVVCVGTNEDTSRAALDLVGRDNIGDRAGWSDEAGSSGQAESTESSGCVVPELFATVGLHPHEASRGTEGMARLLEGLSGAPGGFHAARLVGIGECGLDYHYEHSPRDAQRDAFISQIAMAREHDLTLVIHTRDAWDDTFAILGKERLPERVIFHCFTGGLEEAKRCIDLGAWLSFSGIVTFKNAGALAEAASWCPADRLLVETDSPWLAPVPYRGQRNEPAYVVAVGERVAGLRDVAPEDLAEVCRGVTCRAFGLLDPGS